MKVYLFCCDDERAQLKDVLCRISGNKMYLIVEGELCHTALQPYVHSVRTRLRRPIAFNSEYYAIFHKRHVRLPRNESIRAPFYGDTIVARLDATGRRYVPMENNERQFDRVNDLMNK